MSGTHCLSPVDTRHVTATAVPLSVVCGTALWTSLGVLDAYNSPAGAVRVAMLPSGATWLGLVTLATLIVTGVGLWLRRLPGRARPSADARGCSTLGPLAAVSVLILPYLPWLPDAFPVLTVLAGPLRWLVWLVVLAETARRVIARAFVSRHPAVSGMPGQVALRLFVLGTVVFGLAAARLTGTPFFPGGDEPHYLIMAQSLWRDGDLAIENNHEREDYREYYGAVGALRPHYLKRGIDGEIYSVHPVGLPVVLAPIYGLGGYTAVRLFLVAISAATLAAAAWWMIRLGLSRRAVVVGWLAILSSAPFFFFSFAVYPETLAGFAVIIGMLLSVGDGGARIRDIDHDRFRWLAIGSAVAVLPWLSTKYAPMAAALGVVALGRIWWSRPHPSMAGSVRATARLAIPCIVSGIGWLWFFNAFWGSPWPDAPYGGNSQTHPIRLLVGVPGLIFDQEYGVLPNAPIYGVGLIGLVSMWRAGGTSRRVAGEVTLVVAALLGTVGAFHLWWGGSAPPGRPVVSGLPLLGLPIAWVYARARHGSAARTLIRILLVVGIGLTGLFALASGGLLLANDRDGSAAMLDYLSTVWALPTVFPTFIGGGPLAALRVIAVWLGVGMVTTWAVLHIRHVGVATVLASTATVTAAAVVLSHAVPFVSPTRPGDLLEGRWQIGLLDSFDADRRPTGVVYDPLRRVDPLEMASLVPIVVSPPRTPSDQGPEADFLYGRRLALPGGRYDLEVWLDSGTAEASGRLSLMVGRFGAPLATWDVSLSDRDVWTSSFELATDATFMGFQATATLLEARPLFVVRASHINDAHARRNHPQVTATLRTDTGLFYFLDDDVWLEPSRFWTRGARLARVLIPAPPGRQEPATAARLRVHCGNAANEVAVTSDRGREVVSLAAGDRHEFVVPVSQGSALVGIHAATGFRPSEQVPGDADTRYLGCEIEDIAWLP